VLFVGRLGLPTWWRDARGGWPGHLKAVFGGNVVDSLTIPFS
jgi:hypothetical protein